MDPRGLRRLLIAATLLAALSPAFAAPRLRVLVQRAPLAGFTHHEAPAVWTQLRVGAPLTLQREPYNSHDGRAIAVSWQGHKLGYLPRAENDAVSAAMDAGTAVEARIGQLTDDADPRRRVMIEVFILP